MKPYYDARWNLTASALIPCTPRSGAAVVTRARLAVASHVRALRRTDGNAARALMGWVCFVGYPVKLRSSVSEGGA